MSLGTSKPFIVSLKKLCFSKASIFSNLLSAILNVLNQISFMLSFLLCTMLFSVPLSKTPACQAKSNSCRVETEQRRSCVDFARTHSLLISDLPTHNSFLKFNTCLKGHRKVFQKWKKRCESVKMCLWKSFWIVCKKVFANHVVSLVSW